MRVGRTFLSAHVEVSLSVKRPKDLPHRRFPLPLPLKIAHTPFSLFQFSRDEQALTYPHHSPLEGESQKPSRSLSTRPETDCIELVELSKGVEGAALSLPKGPATADAVGGAVTCHSAAPLEVENECQAMDSSDRVCVHQCVKLGVTEARGSVQSTRISSASRSRNVASSASASMSIRSTDRVSSINNLPWSL